jgi:hypothetical protein
MKKILLTTITITISIFAYLNYYRYALPDTNGVDLSGKQALVTDGEILSLYEYVDVSKCKNSGDNKTQYKMIYGTTCAKVTLIDSKVKDTLRSTAILSGGGVVYSKEESGEYNMYLWQDGAAKKVKTYKVFDLGKFAIDYRAGVVKLTNDIESQTGIIYQDRFRVIDENTIGFIDAMVDKVDGEKPVEVISRERTLNLLTGEMREREKERDPVQ